MPIDHQQFFQELQFIHEIPGFIFVHGGLSSHKSVEEQLQRLRARDCSQDRPLQLFGHEDLYDSPASLRDVCVVSGHHGFVLFNYNRIILDNIGNSNDRELMAIVLPQFDLIDDRGEVTKIDPSDVYKKPKPSS